MRTEPERRWCLFTSAGEKNAIDLWLRGSGDRRWDLVVAYYGDSDFEFSILSEESAYAFRSKGGKFQNLKKLLDRQPQFLDRYSHVWVCDDDIRMSCAQIDEAFAIAETCDFWVAQPAFDPRGQNTHRITVYAGPGHDYRTVNFIENGVALFRRDKLLEFLRVYDGSLAGYGIDYWYMNVFGPEREDKYAVIDRVQVINPTAEDKGGREIERLQPIAERRAAWVQVQAKYGVFEYAEKVFACCKLNAVPGAGAAAVIERSGFPEPDTSRGRDQGPAWAQSTLAERLGYGPEARLLIVHADDIAVTHSVNVAFVKGLETGLINSGSVIVASPWFPEIAAYARAHPRADIGVHLALTSERSNYRWGPTAQPSEVPSLIDELGYLRRELSSDRPPDLREVAIELRAQIERAHAAGLKPTHLDSHQYSLLRGGRELFSVVLALGREYRLPVFVARSWLAHWPHLVEALTPADVVVDHAVSIDADVAPERWGEFYRNAVEALRPGITQFIIHPGLDDPELRAFSADRASWGAEWRQRDLDFFTSPEFRDLLAQHDISLVTWRDIATRFRERNAGATEPQGLGREGGVAADSSAAAPPEAGRRPARKRTVCLNMIVKNEAQIIERCLSSLKPHIDYWVIVDTGSTDGTQALIKRLLEGVPGELHARPWKNFAYNRTEAIRLAEGKADYLLFCDADMTLEVRDPAWREKLEADSYLALQRYDGGFHYLNLRLANARLKGERRWRYWGSTHEYCGPVAIGAREEPARIDTIEFIDHGDGSSRPEKYVRDSQLLEHDLAELERLDRLVAAEPSRTDIGPQLEELRQLETRNVFYLAQTYREMERLEESLKLYERRVTLGGWHEEVWFSLYQIARLSEQLGRPEATIVERYLKAYEYRPRRVEPLVHLARYYRLKNRYALAHIFARRAIEIPRPPDDYLFIDGACYDWLNRDEYAVAAYFVGDYKEAARVCRELLDGPALPESERGRIRGNLEHAQRALAR